MREAGAISDRIPVDAAPGAGKGAPGLSVSVETLAWSIVVGAGAALRLGGLTRLPLTLSEAARALEEMRVAEGTVPEAWRGDLLAALTSYLFRLFGESDLAARIVPALAGVGLVAAIWLTRPYVGRAGALAAAVLVAFSPLFLVTARSGEPYSTGSLLALLMVVSLFAYLREPRAWVAFALAVTLGLAPLTDAVAFSAALAIGAFVTIEAGLQGSSDVERAWGAFRRSPVQWVSALLVLGAALQLGLTHFGTSLDRTGLPGLRLWADIFETPRDGRAPEYHFALLLAYDWPLLLAGAAGLAALALRVRAAGRRSVPPLHRFLPVWTAAGALTLALASQRDAGQLVIVLLPLALLGGRAAEEWLPRIDWYAVWRLWPVLAGAVVLVGGAALLMTQWASGHGQPWERPAMALAFGAALLLVIAPVVLLGRSGVAPGLAAGTLVAVAFAAHTSSSVALRSGSEFAVDERLLPRAEDFRATVDRLAAERGGTVVVDESLLPALGWTLRDSPVVFGGPVEGATAVVATPNAAPSGFVGLGDVFHLAEGWYPEALLRPRSMWRWLLYRDSYGDTRTIEVRFYVPTV